QQEYPHMDGISNLPPSIIETILCLLPYHDVVTGVMRRRLTKCHGFCNRDGISITNLFESLKMIESLTIWREIIEGSRTWLETQFKEEYIPKQVQVTLVHLKSLCIGDIYLDGYYGLQIIALFIKRIKANRDEDGDEASNTDGNMNGTKVVDFEVANKDKVFIEGADDGVRNSNTKSGRKCFKKANKERNVHHPCKVRIRLPLVRMS
nr:F-box/FBD/LRR-repeat protein At1g13570-like [Tanacetum cinerariifolium]